MATVFTDDDDAFDLWRRVAGLSDERILRLGEKDNFWAMGDTGPCGPCSEVHFHQGDDLPCAEVAAGGPCLGPACDCDRWLEIWNLVFMQFNRDLSGAMTPLPRPSIDTGMGLERIAAVLQGKRSSFDTDLLRTAPRAHLATRRARATGRARTTTCPCASSRTTRGRRPSSSATASCPPTSGAATCCAASCAAPCVTGECSASPSPSCGGRWPGSARSWGGPIRRSWPTRRASRRSSAKKRSASPRRWTTACAASRTGWRTGPRPRARRGRSTDASSSRCTTPMAFRAISPRRSCATTAGQSPTATEQAWNEEMEAQRQRARAGAAFGDRRRRPRGRRSLPAPCPTRCPA